MQHLEGKCTPVLYIGRTVLKVKNDKAESSISPLHVSQHVNRYIDIPGVQRKLAVLLRGWYGNIICIVHTYIHVECNLQILPLLSEIA